jgi:hypothetical protein
MLTANGTGARLVYRPDPSLGAGAATGAVDPSIVERADDRGAPRPSPSDLSRSAPASAAVGTRLYHDEEGLGRAIDRRERHSLRHVAAVDLPSRRFSFSPGKGA